MNWIIIALCIMSAIALINYIRYRLVMSSNLGIIKRLDEMIKFEFGRGSKRSRIKANALADFRNELKLRHEK